MEWSKGYSARFYATIVDPISWKDVREIDIESGTIERSTDNAMESASILCGNYEYNTEQWIRIHMDARQEGDSKHVQLFTGLASSPELSIDGTKRSTNIKCYSVLKPAGDVLLDRGWYSPKGADAPTMIKKLLRILPAPVDIEGATQIMQDSIIAEDGETHLSMVNKILNATKLRLVIEGSGRVVIKPPAAYSSALFDSNINDCLETSVTITYDWFDAPNVFRAVYNDGIAVAKDTSLDSPLSIINRGREVWMEEKDCKLSKDQTLASYARKRLKEEQQVSYTISYSRRYYLTDADEDVRVNDLIDINYPQQSISGTFKIKSQTITLGYHAKISETANKYGS